MNADNKIKIAFYVTGNATRMKHIIKTENKEVMDAIGIVISDVENLELQELLQRYKITYKCITKQLYANSKYTFSDLLLEELIVNEIDYIFVFGMKILKGNLLKQYRNKIINFHPSILPMFSGCNAIDQAVDAGMTILGNTAHFIDESIDGGPIILQDVFSVQVFYEEGYEGVLKYQEGMFFRLFELLKDNKIHVDKYNRVFIDGTKQLQEIQFPMDE